MNETSPQAARPPSSMLRICISTVSSAVIETPLELMSARNLMTKSMPDLPHFLRHMSERCWLAKSLRKKLRYARSTFSMVSFEIL